MSENNDVSDIRAAIDEAREWIGVKSSNAGQVPGDKKLDAIVRALDMITDRLESL